VARVAREREPCEYEYRVRTAGGEYRWVLTRAVALHDERGDVVRWYGTDTDMDDRKRAEETLRREESELRQITDAIPRPSLYYARTAHRFTRIR
jgi:PAS fold